MMLVAGRRLPWRAEGALRLVIADSVLSAVRQLGSEGIPATNRAFLYSAEVDSILLPRTGNWTLDHFFDHSGAGCGHGLAARKLPLLRRTLLL
jgi:hypothetical protein